MLCDKHLNSQLRESSQMLATAVRMRIGKPGKLQVYKKRLKAWVFEDRRYVLPGEDGGRPIMPLDCYHNHCCNVWLRECTANWNWLMLHAMQMGEEYRLRYGRTHKSDDIIVNQILPLEPESDGSNIVTPWAQAMPEKYQRHGALGAVFAYRAYYVAEKSKIAKWQHKHSTPSWWVKEVLDAITA